MMSPDVILPSWRRTTFAATNDDAAMHGRQFVSSEDALPYFAGFAQRVGPREREEGTVHGSGSSESGNLSESNSFATTPRAPQEGFVSRGAWFYAGTAVVFCACRDLAGSRAHLSRKAFVRHFRCPVVQKTVAFLIRPKRAAVKNVCCNDQVKPESKLNLLNFRKQAGIDAQEHLIAVEKQVCMCQ